MKEGTIDVLGGGEGDPWIKTFFVPKDVKAQFKMVRHSREMSLEQLGKALRVSLKLADDRKTVASLRVQLPAFRGTVGAVDPKKGQITTGEKTYAVDEETTIFIQNRPGELADVAPGMFATYFLSPDRSRMVVIQAFRPERERE